MDDSDLDIQPEPESRTEAPTILWLGLGFVLIVVFAALVFLLVGHGAPHAVGPPPGTPD